ncbi:uncharacterized protein LOC135822527 isoform X1 [Sycon ciliatum]|uniref:uncharacterized protein LOC135822527 isoform X1 n=1 Tax=Sycon ciliatum TaxID=27933 RepID=UPI0031F6DD74
MATGPGQDGRKPAAQSMRDVERLIYRNKRFWEGNLCVTTDMIDDFQRIDLFPSDKLAELQALQHQHAADPLPCQPVNKLLVKMVLQLYQDQPVTVFLACIRRHQKELYVAVHGGQDVGMEGTLSISAGSSTSGPVPRQAHGQQECRIDRSLYPEEVVHFEDSEVYRERQAAMEAESDEDMDVDGGSQSIGAEGGSFPADDESLNVIIPPGALDHPTEVFACAADMQKTVDTEHGPVYIGRVLFFGEHGTTFRRPATVTVTDHNTMPGNKVYIFGSDTAIDELPHFTDVTETCRPRLDTEQHTITFQIDHFSFYVYAIVAVSVPIATIAYLLQNCEVRVYVYAKHPIESDSFKLQVIVERPGPSPTPPKQGYYEVGDDHDKVLMACFDNSIDIMLESTAAGGSAIAGSGHIQPWKLEKGSERRLEQGMECPDSLSPVLVRNEESDMQPYPFSAAFVCETCRVGTKFLVNFRIDKAKVDEQHSKSSPVAPAPRKPPPPCPHHTSGTPVPPIRMMSIRKRALELIKDYLARDTGPGDIGVMLEQIADCRVLSPGCNDYRCVVELNDRNLHQEAMRHLVAVVVRRQNAAFDCFVHAVWQFRHHLADQLLDSAQEDRRQYAKPK